MGMKRKDALKRLKSLAYRVQIHLEKITANPEHREVNHWKREVRGWLGEIEDLLLKIGRKTAAEWAYSLATWKAKMEQSNDYE